jgi:protein kinase-like protein
LQAALADRYSITRELGRGATATVYLAQDLKHAGTLVAIKVLAEEFALVVRTERFLAEIQTAARLTHPHILKLLDSGSAGGLLYYVMPYIDGGTVADRLERDGPLPVEEAVRLAREVADALDYAHSQNVTHRDIKPGNILLASGHAWVADFGIASAIEVGDTGMTATGAHLGTPPYMSPEQVTGDRKVDGRTDIYSLGCTLYEMLCGETPFQGPDIQTMLRRRLVEPPPSVRSVRPDVPEWLDDVLLVALATDAADRFPTGRAFEQALAQQGEGLVPRPRPVPVPEPWRIPRRVLAALVPVSLAVVVVVVWGATRDAKLDPRAVVVLPPEGDSTVPAAKYGEALTRDALGAWKGIDMVERGKVWEALADRGRPLDTRGALAIARSLKAGRYIRTEVSPFGDSTRVHATLYDATTDGTVQREVTIKLGPGLVGATSTYAALVDQLLFGPSTEPTGTHSYPARLAFARGQAAVQEWELEKADSAFRQATDADPDYAQAHLWVAQVRFWKDTVTATWRSSAERSAVGRVRLARRDQTLSDALVAQGHGDVVGACAAWQRLTAGQPNEFVGWYSLATCLRRDNAVLHDPRSPSTWRFRTSYYRATRAYQRAFLLWPLVHKGMSQGSYQSVRGLLMTGSNWRFGRAVQPDTTHFAAYAAWQANTLAVTPYPRATPVPVPASRAIAVQHQRELFLDIATGWVTAFPQSPDALVALSTAQGMLSDPSAVETLSHARAFAKSPTQRLRVAAAEVWARVRLSAPGDLTALRAARALADSILEEYGGPTPDEPLLLASLAALTGRAQLAAQLTKAPAAVSDWRVPPPLMASAGPLLALAALGGPPDSLREYEARVNAGINQLPPLQRQAARMRWLARPATLAYPDHRFTSLPDLAGADDYDVDAQAAFDRGDSVVARRVFDTLTRERQRFSPSDVTYDALYPEVWLLAKLGDDRLAVAWLDATLHALPTSDPQAMFDVANAGALVRAMALRAELAQRQGDFVTAKQWARVVAVLWTNADPFLQNRIRIMERIARSDH